MALRVYQSGDDVALKKDANPVLLIPQIYCVFKVINEDIDIYSTNDATVGESDIIANVQDSIGTPIGNLQDVIKYINVFILQGSSVGFPTIGGGGTGEINTGSNVGAGDGVFKQKTGVDLEFKTLIGGTNTTITNNANDLTIDVTGTGEVNTASNVGTGDGVFKQKTGVDLEMKTLIGGTNVTIVNNANDLTISATVTGNYFKDSVIITSVSNNFNSATPTDIPLMTYTITQDGDYILYAIVNTNPDQNEGFNIYYAINGVTVNDSIICQEFKKNKDVSIQGTWDVDGLVIGDIITIQGDTKNDNQDLITRRIIIQSWT